jgi:hypothetical protein
MSLMSPDVRHLPVDGHVHFHELGLVAPTLDAAATNFVAVSGRSTGTLGALLLTQAAGERVFESLKGPSLVGGWRIEPVQEEPQTLIARRAGATIAIICGRQVRATDGLEVLALGTLETFPDGMQFPETVDAVCRSGALTAVPWGFGKWLGARGQRVKSMFALASPADLFVGDNGGRVGSFGVPAIVQSAAEKGFRVLPGTDPFPFSTDYRRVGSFGFLADVEADEVAPWRTLRAWLVGLRQSPKPYGSTIGLPRFVVNQAGIQVYNRFFRSRAA